MFFVFQVVVQGCFGIFHVFFLGGANFQDCLVVRFFFSDFMYSLFNLVKLYTK